MTPTHDVDDKVFELRRQGSSFKAIARAIGFRGSSGAMRAFNRSLRRHPAEDQAALLAEELHRLEGIEARVRANTALEAAEAERRIQAVARIRAMVSAS
ncbi:MAG: hypothetical protein ACLGIO_15140 [Acidimicrobiia bacterium]